MLRLYVLLFFFLSNLVFCYSSSASWDNHSLMFLTFAGNLICILIGFYQSMAKEKLNLDTIIWVFVYMFFFIAPVVQLKSGLFFPNTMPIHSDDVIRTNFVILVWNFVYLLFRAKSARLPQPEQIEQRSGLETVHAYVKTIYFILSFAIFLVTIALFKQRFFLGMTDYGQIIGNKSAIQLLNISFQGITFANWLFVFDRWRRDRKLASSFRMLMASIILLNQLSPFNTSRFYIGFCLILIVYLFYYHSLKPSQFIWIIFTGLLFIFPFLNMFRYGINGYETPTPYHLMFDQLTELHFDAFSNFAATMQYCTEYGYSFGYQMLGVILFFVPRNIWHTKPLSSGEAIGDFISGQYTLNFNNLSNPLPSEFMINFGWIGILAGAILLAWFVNKLEAGVGENRYVHALIAGYLFIILRGDLMNAFAYCFGTYVVMVLLPNGYSRILNRQKNPALERRLRRNGKGVRA